MNNNLALVVDDSKLARAVLKKLLVEQGLDVDTSSSAEEALVYLYSRQPDVIFMDHTMPGMDGLLAVKAIKKNPKTAMIPIMMHTSKEGEMYVSQARALGAVGVLPKQMAHQELKKVLAELRLLPGQTNTYHHIGNTDNNDINEPFEESLAPIQIKKPEGQEPVRNDFSNVISHIEVTEAANTASDYQANKALKSNLQELFENQTAIIHSDLETSSNQISDKVLSNIEGDLSLRLDEIFEERKPKKRSGFSFISMALIASIVSVPFAWLFYENFSLNKNLEAYSNSQLILAEAVEFLDIPLDKSDPTKKDNAMDNDLLWQRVLDKLDPTRDMTIDENGMVIIMNSKF